MQKAHRLNVRPVEYFRLVEPQADGPVIGIYGDRPIAASVIDAYGQHYAYVGWGVAPRLRSGVYDVDALKKSEWLVEPGLVYASDDGVADLRRARRY